MFDSKIIAHRGVFDNIKIVENTIPSFSKAIAFHYPIELDVQLTLDNKIVVFHDEDLSRLAGKNVIIQKMNYDELKKISLLNTNSYIPLLSEVLKLNQDKVTIDIEVKTTKRIDETISYLLNELKNYHNYVIKSFDVCIIRKIKKQNPNIRTGLLIKDHYQNNILDYFFHSSFMLHYSKCDFVAISKKMLKKSKLMKKYSSYPILVWTIKKKEEINYEDSFIYICNNLPYVKQ